MVKISSSGIKIVLTCITHNYMSYWTPRRSFRHPWGPHNGPKHHPNGPRGTWRARRVQIWSQLPPIGLTGLESWLSDTLTWDLAASGPPGNPKGPDLAQNSPFGGPNRPLRLDLVPTATNWSEWAGIIVTRHFDLVSGLFWPPGIPKGSVLAHNAPLEGLRGTRTDPLD